MPPKRKRATTTAPPPPARNTSADLLPPTPNDIATRAYHLFLQRGCEHGRDQDDWLQAEHELRSMAS
jgi:hypothetical protein